MTSTVCFPCDAFEDFLVPIVSSEKILLDVLGWNTTPQCSYFVAGERGLALYQISNTPKFVRTSGMSFGACRVCVCLLVDRFRRQFVGPHVAVCCPW
jgi:hypothetical protein